MTDTCDQELLVSKIRRLPSDKRSPELEAAAEELEAALDNPKTHVARLVGSWAKARRLYCEATGEPLV